MYLPHPSTIYPNPYSTYPNLSNIYPNPSGTYPNPSTIYPNKRVLRLNENMKMKRVPELPEAYTNVRPANIPKKPSPPPVVCHSIPAPQSIQSHLKEEFAWLEGVSLTENVSDGVSITWSAHHAARKRSKPFEVSISALMPLLRDQAHSVATMKHAMKKICDTVAFPNPGQIPVIAADQPCML